MRNLLTLLGLILFAACSINAQTKTVNQMKTDRETAGLAGQVKSVRLGTVKLTEVDGQPVEGERHLLEVLTYDEQGGVTGQTAYKPDGSIGSKHGWSSTYDGQGREAERAYYDAEGRLTSKSKSTYDNRGRRVELTYYNPDGAINHIQSFSYDDRGNVVGVNHRNPDGTARTTQSFNWDAKGLRKEVKFYRPDGLLSQKSIYTYDERGNQIEWLAFDAKEKLQMKWTRSFDAKGNLLESTYGDGTTIGSKVTYTDEFDSHGNWIKRKIVREIFKEGKSRFETEVFYREISYH